MFNTITVRSPTVFLTSCSITPSFIFDVWFTKIATVTIFSSFMGLSIPLAFITAVFTSVSQTIAGIGATILNTISSMIRTTIFS